MHMRTAGTVALTGLAMAAFSSPTHAVNYPLNWMSLAPTPFNSAPPFSGTYNLPGIGAVQMTYTANSDFAEARAQNAFLASGSVTSGGDTYSWTNHEMLGRTNWGNSGAINTTWTVTYTFPGTIPAGQIFLGVAGLGRRNPDPGETVADAMSLATVLQNGTHLGDYTGAQNWGPTLYTSGAGTFNMRNSLTGNGGADPWWNTGLAVVRINDPISSLSVQFDHTRGDGLGVNIASIVPEPASLALLAVGLPALIRRRRARH